MAKVAVPPSDWQQTQPGSPPAELGVIFPIPINYLGETPSARAGQS